MYVSDGKVSANECPVIKSYHFSNTAIRSEIPKFRNGHIVGSYVLSPIDFLKSWHMLRSAINHVTTIQSAGYYMYSVCSCCSQTMEK